MARSRRWTERSVGLVAAIGILLVAGVLLTPPPPSTSFANEPAPTTIVATEEAEPASPTPMPPTATTLPTALPTPTAIATPEPRPTLAPSPSPTAAPPTRVVQPAKPGAGVPILMYHYIRANPDPRDQIGYGLSITPDLFAAHMAFLDERGFRAVPMRELGPYVGTGKLPSEKSVAITFDDGYRDAYTEAWPVLKKYGFSATMYVITDLIDHERYLTQEQIRELAAAGIEIGSHSATHPELPALGGARLRHEVVDSRDVLERLLGGPVASFCYPSGHFTAAVRQAVQAAGYTTAVTVDPGIFRGREDAYQIPRVRVYGGMGLAQFARAIGESPPDPKKWGEFLADRAQPRA